MSKQSKRSRESSLSPDALDRMLRATKEMRAEASAITKAREPFIQTANGFQHIQKVLTTLRRLRSVYAAYLRELAEECGEPRMPLAGSDGPARPTRDQLDARLPLQDFRQVSSIRRMPARKDSARILAACEALDELVDYLERGKADAGQFWNGYFCGASDALVAMLPWTADTARLAKDLAYSASHSRITGNERVKEELLALYDSDPSKSHWHHARDLAKTRLQGRPHDASLEEKETNRLASLLGKALDDRTHTRQGFKEDR